MPNMPYREARPWSRRQKRVAGGAAAVVLLGLGGALVWSQTHEGDYAPSANGCVTVLAPSTMGAQVLHRCGDEARTWCHSEYAANDRLALLVQPECRRAGITPEPDPSGTPGG
jgi:hypothetical protein